MLLGKELDLFSVDDAITFLQCFENCFVVVVCGVLGDGTEVVAGKEFMDFVVVVLGVDDYRRLAFISLGNHGVIVGDFLVNLF